MSDTKRLKRLFIGRFFASVTLFALFYWADIFLVTGRGNIFPQLISTWAILSVIQWLFTHFSRNIVANLLFQLTSDLILIGFIIYGTGGIDSPFVFLLGLVIITAGTQEKVIMPLIISVFSAITHLISVYTYSKMQQQVILAEDTLNLLLQTSLFFLAGSIMAIIARRYTILEKEQKIASTKHKQLKEIHSQVLTSMQEGVLILDTNFMIQTFNENTALLLDIKQKHIGHNLSSFVEISQSMLDFTSLNSHNVFRCEILHHNKFLLLTLTQLQGVSETWLMTIVNITETRELEQQLAEQDKLATIGQMAAMLAHEIRNPMQTIAQAVELMSLSQKDDKLEGLVSAEISRLNRLVSDMLDFASPLYPCPSSTDINSTIQSAIMQADLKGIYNIQVDILDHTSMIIDSDHLRLVLDNLLRNALRASPAPASIHISFKLDEVSWQLQIKDHGPGIANDIKRTLFKAFETGHKQGIGLGLATVWQVCQVNHWDISVDNHVKSGACFTVCGNISPMNLQSEEKNG